MGGSGFLIGRVHPDDIAEIVLLDHIVRPHELVEHPAKPGRVIFAI